MPSRRVEKGTAPTRQDSTGDERESVERIKVNVPGSGSINLSLLAKESEGFSGGLIKNAVLLAMCEVASREKDKQLISQQDLIRSAQCVRRASQEVGPGQTVWTEFKELP